MSFFDFNSPAYVAQLRQKMIFDMMNEFAITSPRAQAKVTGVIGPELREAIPLFTGMRVIETDSPFMGEDTIWFGDTNTVYLQKYSRYGERTGLQALKKTPFYSRHDLGVREAARARRRARRGMR